MALWKPVYASILIKVILKNDYILNGVAPLMTDPIANGYNLFVPMKRKIYKEKK